MATLRDTESGGLYDRLGGGSTGGHEFPGGQVQGYRDGQRTGGLAWTSG
ncbi:MAG: hypothetical protein AB7H85_03285 [Dehalococcoidia bacterium]